MRFNSGNASRVAIVALALLTQACSPMVITGVSFGELSQRPNSFCDGLDVQDRARCTPELLASLKFAALGAPISVVIDGQGRCALATVDFGDGSVLGEASNVVVDRAGTVRVPHTYAGWPGKKTVHVRGRGDCTGEVRQDITVGFAPDGRESYRAAFAPNARQCNFLIDTPTQLAMPALRAGTGVRIVADGGTINYGASSQTFNASGDPAAVVPAGYTFMDKRKFSLVYRVGTDTFQGESGSVVFTTTQPGRLEVCVNDNPGFLTDNRGGMLLTITVNERSGAAP